MKIHTLTCFSAWSRKGGCPHGSCWNLQRSLGHVGSESWQSEFVWLVCLQKRFLAHTRSSYDPAANLGRKFSHRCCNRIGGPVGFAGLATMSRRNSHLWLLGFGQKVTLVPLRGLWQHLPARLCYLRTTKNVVISLQRLCNARYGQN